MEYTFLGKRISGCFTIPSGIITTQPSVIQRIAEEIPEIGVITTKSIGLEPREGYREPVLTQYAPGCFMNAVGLTNPGAEAFARELRALSLPSDRFILTSIFGKDTEEFVQVAKLLAPVSDGLELNLSCPHAGGYGMAIGHDPQRVRSITQAVKQAVDVPVIPKLTPNVDDVTVIARAAADGGADALCAINTVGPGYVTAFGHPILTNQYGGMSGKGILPLGLKCVREIAEAVEVPIVGCGGISTAEDVRAYQQAGASIFGIGSALAGLSTDELKMFFQALSHDLERNTNRMAELLSWQTDLSFQECRVTENRCLATDLSLLTFDCTLPVQPGQFIFVWLPDGGEKPFSVLDSAPVTLAVQQRGCFTTQLCQVQPGDTVYLRGPYGQSVNSGCNIDRTILVCGGCGLAAVYQIACERDEVELFIGAKDARHLFYLEQARRVATMHVATEDGSWGQPGLVTDLLRQHIAKLAKDMTVECFNCGPEAMIAATVEIERRYAAPEDIYSSVDYVTKCGVGLCGSCATPDGERLCVDGPFL